MDKLYILRASFTHCEHLFIKKKFISQHYDEGMIILIIFIGLLDKLRLSQIYYDFYLLGKM